MGKLQIKLALMSIHYNITGIISLMSFAYLITDSFSDSITEYFLCESIGDSGCQRALGSARVRVGLALPTVNMVILFLTPVVLILGRCHFKERSKTAEKIHSRSKSSTKSQKAFSGK